MSACRTVTDADMATFKGFFMAIRMLGDIPVAEDVIKEAETITKATE